MVDLLDRYAIYARDDNRCVYCGDDVSADPTLDHVEPQRDGRPSNLVTACRKCNAAKGDRPLQDFLRDAGLSEDRQGQIRGRIALHTRRSLVPFRRDPVVRRRAREAEIREADRLGML